jgi:hypothetical protein
MRRPRARFVDLSTVIIGALKKPSQTGRKTPDVRVPATRAKYKGQCPTCGGSHVINSPAGLTMLCPYCTGYQKCGL